MNDLAIRAAALVGGAPDATERLHGGDLAVVLRLRLSDGRSIVAKSGPTARAEAAMLRAIRAADVPAPAVLAVAADLLVLEDLGTDAALRDAWGDLGCVLRRLHSVRGAEYGWSEDHAFGPVPIPNAPAETWPDFWAARRLLPACPVLPPDLARRVARLADRLPEILPRQPGAALLHGDLWSGNVMACGGRITGLIDPACYFGHAEVDLAMLTLFARPEPAFWQGYGAPEPGAYARRPVYQLWPALVHLRLFGAGYRGMVENCLSTSGV